MADAHVSSETNNAEGGIVKNNYYDEEVRAIEILNIHNYSPDDGSRAWENILGSLRDGITKEGMLQLISLACHIQSREGEPLMKGRSSNHSTRTITNGTQMIRSQSRFVAQVQESARVSQNEEEAQHKFKAICYFAACLMRLVSKTPDNFMRALGNIKYQYSMLYSRCSTYLYSLRFERSMAEHISLAFRLFPEFRCTIAHHVAIAEEEHTGNWKSMRILRFACIQHLEFNGMTAYSQCVYLINRLKLLSPGLYLTWLTCPENSPALHMIFHILSNHHCPPQDGRTPSKFWKYAKIFDSRYFLELQPKSCKYLMAIQAYLIIEYPPDNKAYQSPLEIAVIKDDKAVLSSAKLMADAFMRAYHMLRDRRKLEYGLTRGITKEMAGDNVKTSDISSVQFEETGPLWCSINRSKIEEGDISTKSPGKKQKLERGDISYPRFQEAGGPSNSMHDCYNTARCRDQSDNPIEGENSCNESWTLWLVSFLSYFSMVHNLYIDIARITGGLGMQRVRTEAEYKIIRRKALFRALYK